MSRMVVALSGEAPCTCRQAHAGGLLQGRVPGSAGLNHTGCRAPRSCTADGVQGAVRGAGRPVVCKVMHSRAAGVCRARHGSTADAACSPCSHSVRLCHPVCCILPSGSTLRPAKQHHRDPPGCQKVCHRAAEASRHQSQRHR